MKKTIVTAITAIAVTAAISIACFAGCAKKSEPVRQFASARLYQDENVITTKVELTDGYSCDFSEGAVYLDDKDGKSVALGLTLDQELYEEYAAHSQEASDRKELNGGVMYKADNTMIYIITVGDNGYFGIFADGADAAQMEAIVARFDLKAGY